MLPLAIKDLGGVSRRWQTYAMRTGYLALVALVIWGVAGSSRKSPFSLGASDLAQLARDIFDSFYFLQMVFVIFASVTAASDLVTREVRAGTLGLLALTPLTPLRIALGKWQAAMAHAAFLILGGLPVVVLCVYLGGVGVGELSWSTATTFASAAFAAALALFFSSVFRTGAAAAVATFIALLTPVGISAFNDWGPWESTSTFASIIPFYSGIAAINRSGSAQDASWMTSCPLTLLAAFGLLALTARRIGAAATATPRPPLLSRVFDAMDRFYDDLEPARFRALGLFRSSDEVSEAHPLLWKELRTRAAGKLRYAARISLAIGLLLFIPATAMVLTQNLRSLPVMLWIGSGVLVVAALSAGVGLFAKEREERKWDVLLSTPLTAGEIVGAKLTAGLLSWVPLAGVLGLLFGFMSWAGQTGPGRFLTAWMSVLLFAGLAYLFAASASLRSRTLRGAFLGGFFLLALSALGPVLLAFLVRDPIYRDMEFLVAASSPFCFLHEIRFRSWGYSGRYHDFEVGYLAWTLVYSGIQTFTILARMPGRLNRLAGRV